MSNLLGNYKRFDVDVVKGKGVYLADSKGCKYLDFAAGVAVSALGYGNKNVIRALKKQSELVWHTSNLYYNVPAKELACALAGLSLGVDSKVFFCNSGAEAIECAVKVVRKYFYDKGEVRKNRVITFSGSFHGRTLATISAARNPKHIEGFEPLVDGFDRAVFGDMESVDEKYGPHTAAVLVEVVQGEGGVNFAGFEFIVKLREFCNRNGLLLVIDEIQTGIGRTGKMFAYEWCGVKPDVVCVAKGLGAGFPIGACIIDGGVAGCMGPGTHGSTFGGNPLGCAVGLEVVKIVSEKKFLQNVLSVSHYLEQCLVRLKSDYPDIIQEVRGLGLMRGIRLHERYSNASIVNELLVSAKIMTVVAGDNVVRLLPPLVISKKNVDIFYQRCNEILKKL